MNQMGAEDNVDLFTLDIESFGMENQQIVLFHYDEKKIELFFVEGAENLADLFTKNLAAPKFIKFRAELGLEFYSS